jgi:hypothetical protein
MSLAASFRRKQCLTVVAGVQARVRWVAYPLGADNMSRPLLFHLRGGHQQNPRKEVIDERKGPHQIRGIFLQTIGRRNTLS